ncbi:unnamed protein product [Caenorhabditis angaria]|uniref:Uncharacterized protein n=1 Tax=Caenorhabditis angaria TaxID=860376 RepID=A0A9P1I870_9PELO|nr:unnamed protein product [Caenorhabditis angaria]
MGCTHSKNSKSKKFAGAPPILNRDQKPQQNTVAHFDAANQKQSQASLSRNILLNNNNNSIDHHGETQRKGGLRQLKTVKMEAIEKERDRDVEEEEEGVAEKRGQIPDDLRAEKDDDATQNGQYFAAEKKPAEIQKYAPSAYYPFPDKQNSPERNKKAPIAQVMENMGAVKVGKRKEVLNLRDNKTVAIAPTTTQKIYRPQLTQEDLDYIKRSVQQRNERRAYMMQHRNESDDTLYELEARMPEKDYTNLRVV